MATTQRIITVWLDETSAPTEPTWIVDTDTEDGGHSHTLSTHDSQAEAEEAGREAADKLGLALMVCGEMAEPAYYLVRDAGDEYLGADGERTPASNEAQQFGSREEAESAFDRATDHVQPIYAE